MNYYDNRLNYLEKELLLGNDLAVLKNEGVTGGDLGIEDEGGLFDDISYLKRRIFTASSLFSLGSFIYLVVY